jgi:hypothetical protein
MIDDQDFKKSWIEALRSGKYREGRGFFLKENDAFCPLGVACEVKQLRWSSGHGGYVFAGPYDWPYVSNSLPPPNWYGLTNDDMLKLVDMSNIGVPFPVIAAWIEENL